MSWQIQFIGTAGNITPALAALAVTTANQDEVNQIAGAKSYLAGKLASIPAGTGVQINCSGNSSATGVSLVISANVITIT